jgi:ATP-binding cassette subfamily F protein 3
MSLRITWTLNQKCLENCFEKIQHTVVGSHDRIFFRDVKYCIRIQRSKNKRIFSDVNYLSSAIWKTCVKSRKRCIKAAASPKESNKASYEEQKKGKALQNRLSKIESQIKQLEKDIQHDENVGSNYNKHY